ncbi:porphobilinogen synthase [Helicobacter sp.]|uniref:porphobilinogen synthase n=1 Tax=Helicobacter sp. TaxID=218 RepID=UPI0025863CF5|nr:porphobilinogen synthase [Helicobacter sp.]MCI7765030.1 porphobilinogen synthase [Helicobacter sp.]
MFKRLRRMRLNPNIREMLTQTTLHKKDFIYPLFITHGKNIRNPIESMSDVFQLSIDEALKECEALQNLGIFSIILFGIPKIKDSIGSEALSPEGIIAQATRAIKEKFPNMLVCVDLCFCEYTDHGHCGILNPKLNSVDNDLTLEILNQQALILAQSGADLIAPSAMMDGMIVSLRTMLDTNGFNHIPLMSYSTKFASGYYGPFRDVAQSTPSFGDRKSYQQNPANRREAILESLEDEAQGADILMVKPALAYLDIVRDIREQTLLPLAVYNVSGEYAMLKFAQKAGIIDYERVLLETMIGFKRAGADIIITYHAKEIANLI